MTRNDRPTGGTRSRPIRRTPHGWVVHRRDRMVRGIDATGSLAVVGALLTTGVVAAGMQSGAQASSDQDKVQLVVAQPSETPRPKATPRTKATWKPKKAATPVEPDTSPPSAQPKPSASTSGS